MGSGAGIPRAIKYVYSDSWRCNMICFMDVKRSCLDPEVYFFPWWLLSIGISFQGKACPDVTLLSPQQKKHLAKSG